MPTVVPSTPFHLSTRHSAKRHASDKNKEGSAGENSADSAASPAPSSNNDGPNANEEEKKQEDGYDDDAPVVLSKRTGKRARAQDEDNDVADGTKVPPIRKASSNPTRIDRILGKYLVAEANLMCMEILEHMNANAESNKLSQSTPPVAIDWREISIRLASKHSLHWGPRECQALWKFLAYEDTPASNNGQDADDDETLVANSDVEDFSATAEILENKRAAFRLNDQAQQFHTNPQHLHGKGLFGDRVGQSTAAEDASEVVAATTPPPSTTPSNNSLPQAAPLVLYPTFDASGFLLSEEAKNMSHYAPLHMVAEQLLKRRPVVPSPAPGRQPLAPNGPTAFSLDKAQVSSPSMMHGGRAPAQPKPSTTALDIFRRMYLDRTSLDNSKIHQLFESAPLDVRSRCHQMAAQNFERYQRECLRLRLYEKSLRGGGAVDSPTLTPQNPRATPPQMNQTASTPHSNQAAATSQTAGVPPPSQDPPTQTPQSTPAAQNQGPPITPTSQK
ncbi:Aste57867_17878 [Aphanomyces stellatus]|uniref:Aste57867_17878 protein n=1 Tax=Aphanomyces stellatus TaxID=120398 RepID=A0A485L8P6_9STRA|nr:hypothetical protein As57867_017817 [Aphanomyces stellatus]VFT94621.1 Aste57867_17878 [Aphanomyces stellatus]